MTVEISGIKCIKQFYSVNSDFFDKIPKTGLLLGKRNLLMMLVEPR